MPAMPRPRPKHLHKEITRHGAVIWYVRMGKGPRIRLKSSFGSPEFDSEYQAALQGKQALPVKSGPGKGSLAWLITQYRGTAEWTNYQPSTRKQRENIFLHIIDKSGHVDFEKITRKAIADGVNRRKATPAAARNFLKTMRSLFAWAKSAQLIETNPTDGVEAKAPKTEGFKIWSEQDCEKFEAYWQIGTRERLAYDLLLYTGLRRGDAVRLGKQHVRDGIATIRMEKTNQLVSFRMMPPLLESIAASPCGDLSFIAGVHGHPMVKESFGTWFRETCRAAGVSGSAHGLRKAGATRAAESGATAHELMAMFGWSDLKTAEIYTRRADRIRLSLAGSDKLKFPAKNKV